MQFYLHQGMEAKAQFTGDKRWIVICALLSPIQHERIKTVQLFQPNVTDVCYWTFQVEQVDYFCSVLKELMHRENGGSIVKLLVFHGSYNVISITLQKKKKGIIEFQQLN